MNKWLFFTMMLSLFLAGPLKSQDPQFSQFYSSPLYLAPSFTGASEKARIIANYRNQWTSLPNAYVTYAFSFDQYLYNYKSGVGAFIMQHQEGGVYKSTNMGLSYSYTIDVNRRLRLRPGLYAASYFRDIDYSEIEFADQLTRNASTSIEIQKNQHIQHYDFSSSLLAYTPNYWLGFTAHHLMALNKQFANDVTYPSLKLAVFGGARVKLFESVSSKIDRFFAVSFFYKTQGKFQQLDVGANYEKEPFRIGLWFRGVPAFNESAGLNAVVLVFGYTFQDFLINYSYDIAATSLFGSMGGAHEISVAYQFNLDWGGSSRKRKMGALPCPQF